MMTIPEFYQSSCWAATLLCAGGGGQKDGERHASLGKGSVRRVTAANAVQALQVMDT